MSSGDPAASGRSQTRGFLSADLRGYSAFTERHGDQAARELLSRYRRSVRKVIASFDGAEIRTEGDSFYRALRTAQDGRIGSLYLFTTPSGGPLYGTAVYREFVAATEAAGLPRIRFHSLRHTAASLLLAQGTHPASSWRCSGTRPSRSQ